VLNCHCANSRLCSRISRSRLELSTNAKRNQSTGTQELRIESMFPADEATEKDHVNMLEATGSRRG
jgi:hypothetical protein